MLEKRKTQISTDDDHLLNQIARKVQAGELVFFLGAGFSKTVNPGYPTSDELKQALLEELPPQMSDEMPLEYVAEVYEKQYGRDELEHFIAKRITFFEPKKSLLQGELSSIRWAELSEWCHASYRSLFENHLTPDFFAQSFAELISPILFLIRQQKAQWNG